MKFSKLILAAALVASTVAVAQADDNVAGHPRVNEVNNRIDRQQDRVAKQEANGKITAEQAARDDKRLANQSQRLSTDEAKHDGHITAKEDAHLNKSLSKNNRIDHRQKAKDAAAQ